MGIKNIDDLKPDPEELPWLSEEWYELHPEAARDHSTMIRAAIETEEEEE